MVAARLLGFVEHCPATFLCDGGTLAMFVPPRGYIVFRSSRVDVGRVHLEETPLVHSLLFVGILMRAFQEQNPE